MADPDFAKLRHIDCILSAEVYAAIMTPGLKVGRVDASIAQAMVFGWILTRRASSRGG